MTRKAFPFCAQVIGFALFLALSVGQTAQVFAAPVLTADKVDFLYTDKDGDAVADLGDVIKFTITVYNQGDVGLTNVFPNYATIIDIAFEVDEFSQS